MSRDEILNMPAGHEMNILIAEKVLGQHHFPSQQVNVWTGGTLGDRFDSLHPFSEQIQFAWEVIEALRGHVKIDRFSDTGGWSVVLTIDRNGKTSVGSSGAETAPLAICRAALLVVGEDKP